jgi:putative PIN family toxin of toxin-antitoxin system
VGVWLMPDMSAVVIDNNIVLDLWLFSDPRSDKLKDALQSKALLWIATIEMREELLRTLSYEHILICLNSRGVQAQRLVKNFDRFAELKQIASKAAYVCKDPDDQKFIDLAVVHKSLLISKDKRVLIMKSRLRRLGVEVTPQWLG